MTLATPATWPLALATFLVRGGIVLVLLPIVVLPTTGRARDLVRADAHVRRVRVDPGPGHRRGRAVGVVAIAWLVVGGWLAAALEAEGARIVARDEEVVALGPAGAAPAAATATSSSRVAARILAARLIASRAARRGPGARVDPPGLRDLPRADAVRST